MKCSKAFDSSVSPRPCPSVKSFRYPSIDTVFHFFVVTSSVQHNWASEATAIFGDDCHVLEDKRYHKSDSPFRPVRECRGGVASVKSPYTVNWR
jgi:hypothetical protein